MPRRPRPPTVTGGLDVQGMGWDDFLVWFKIHWRPGEHVALIGRTGAGKSTFACAILLLRRYVLALDPKGGDSTLKSLGWPRLPTWPPPAAVWDAIAEGRISRYIVGNLTHSIEDWDRLAYTLRKCVRHVFSMGGFTLYADEFQLLADRKMMNLGSDVEKLLVAARDKGVSVVTAYQAPAWVPTAASRQATWIVLWPTKDENVVKALAAIVGRPWRLLQQVMDAIPDFHQLVIGPRPRDPMIITRAPKRLKRK